MNQWTYSNEPKFDFIKLPSGTIINVAHVRRVETIFTTYSSDGVRGQLTRIDTGNDIEKEQEYPAEFNDDGGKIYAWFAERAAEVA